MLSGDWIDWRKEFFTDLYKDREGYVNIAGIRWPEQKFNSGKMVPSNDVDRIERVCQRFADAGYDVYFTPGVFAEPYRRAEYATPSPWIWADIDDGDAEGLEPTYLWSSSPGRYQALWRLSEGYHEVPDTGGLAQALSHVRGFDLGGWDSTQLLRAPGFRSHKRGVVVGESLSTGDRPSARELIVRALTGVCRDANTLELLYQREAYGDRSTNLYSIISELNKLRFSNEVIKGLVKYSCWNKWGSDTARLDKDIARITSRSGHDLEVGPGADDDREPVFSLYRLSDIRDIPPADWLVNGVIERASCGFIAAPPKHFKSWFMLDMCLSVAVGGQFLDHFQSQQAPTLVVEAEDSLERIGERIRAIMRTRYRDYDPSGAISYEDGVLVWRPPKVAPIYITGQPNEGFSQRFFRELQGIIDSRCIGLAMFDTLSMLTSESVSDSQAMYGTVLRPLKSLARSSNCAMMIVHHTRKAQVGGINSGGGALAGSVALHAWSDNSMYVRRDSDSLIVDIESKSQSPSSIVVSGLDTPGLWCPEVSPYSERVPVIEI